MEYQDDFDEPFRIHLNLDNLSEEESKARFSLLYDEKSQSMKRRENTDYLRPICIDGNDVSNSMNRIIRKNMDLFPVDRAVFNVRSISLALWYFISRGHSAIVFLPTNLREFAQRCSDPQELCLLAKLELLVFDESSSLHPSSSVLLSKTIATSAQNSDGCILGSRKKYALLGQKYTELIDRVTNSLIRPCFSLDHELKIGETVRLVLAPEEVHRNEEQTNCMNFQQLVSDQVVIMSKLARIIGKNSMIDLCNRARELNFSAHTSATYRFPPKSHDSTARSHASPYHYNDPFLPDYVAPPPPIALETVAKPSRIGHKHSIYRVGGEKRDDENGEERRISSFRMALVEALTPIFGAEKASGLVENNPELSEINELIEIGLE